MGHHMSDMDKNKPQPGVPEIFDERLVSLRRDRAARRRDRNGESFLLARIYEDLQERLDDVSRTFDAALLIAPEPSANTADMSRKVRKLETMSTKHHTRVQFPSGSFDLVMTLLGPGLVNDLPGALIEARSLLKPDGLFIGAWLGGQSLHELRAAFYADDQARRGGLTPRIHPTINHTQAAQLLVRAGFALPVVDVDRFTVRYGALQTLVEDLRDLGLTNSLASRDRHYLGRDALSRLASHYPREEGRFPASFEILWLTGWSPHPDQPRPLKPGSATHSLAEALGARETKL